MKKQDLAVLSEELLTVLVKCESQITDRLLTMEIRDVINKSERLLFGDRDERVISRQTRRRVPEDP